jgi:hypothetical protein
MSAPYDISPPGPRKGRHDRGRRETVSDGEIGDVLGRIDALHDHCIGPFVRNSNEGRVEIIGTSGQSDRLNFDSRRAASETNLFQKRLGERIVRIG